MVINIPQLLMGFGILFVVFASFVRKTLIGKLMGGLGVLFLIAAFVLGFSDLLF